MRVFFAVLLLILTSAPSGAADIETLRNQALELVNASRAEQDLPPLDFTAPLNEAAQHHADDMQARAYYSHVSPEGNTVMDRYLAADGSRARGVAENIARCAGCRPPVAPERVETLHDGWMHSEGHRENIMNPGYTDFGFGVAASDDGGLYAVQTFGGPGKAEGAALDIEAQRQAALEAVNALRQEADVPPLELAPALSEALMTSLPAEDLARFDMQALGSPLDLLPEDSPAAWRAFSVVAGQCGGCGVQPTAADIDRFLDQWQQTPQYKETLTSRRFTHLGFALAADGSGRKVAVALLAGG